MQKIIANLSLLIGLLLFSCSHPESVDYKRNTSKKKYFRNFENSNSEVLYFEIENGVKYIHATINGMDLRFIFDTGASNISISKSEAITLLKQGTLTEDDIIDIQEFQDATGAISVGTRINLKEVQIGSQILTDVEAIVVDNPYAPLLLGQSVLERFSNIKIDNRNNQIIFEN
jgi:aspartyl protease family protein